MEVVAEYAVVTTIVLLVAIAPLSFVVMPTLSSVLRTPEHIPEGLKATAMIAILASPIYLLLCRLLSVEWDVAISSCLYTCVFLGYETIRRHVYIQSVNASIVCELLRQVTTVSSVLCSAFYGTKSTFWLYLLVGLLIPLFFSYFLLTEKPSLNRELDRVVLVKSFDFGKWIFLTNSLQYLASSLYLLVANTLLSPEAVAGAAVSRSLIGYATVVMLAVDTTLIRRLSGIQNTCDSHELYQEFKRLAYPLFGMYLVIAVGIMPFSEVILEVFFGSRYAEFSGLLVLLIGNSILGFFNKLQFIYFRSANCTRLIFLSSVPGIVFALLMTYPIISCCGMEGGVLVVIISQGINNVVAAFFLKTRLLKNAR